MEQSHADNPICCQQTCDVLDSVTDAIWGINSDWTIYYVNKAVERFVDMSREQLIGSYFWELIPRAKVIVDHLSAAMYWRKDGYYEIQSVIRPDRWMGVHVYPSNNGITMIVRDITERKLMERILRQREQECRTLVENSPDLIARYDREIRHCYVNPQFCLAAGFDMDDIIGKTWGELGIDTEEAGHMQENILKVFASGEPLVFDTQFQNRLRTKRFLQIHAAPEFDINGEVASVLVIGRDVTEQKQFERDMDRLERMNLIGEMAASIGHEVRNPMTTVRGFIQMFKQKKELAPYTEFLELMIEELDRANGIITEFLSLAKNRTVTLKPANLNDIIRSLSPLLAADALRRGQQLVTELDDIPKLLLDEKDIRQLILNLVHNAMEAMGEGGQVRIVTINGGSEILLAVKDQGNGIPPDVLEKIGTPFFTTKDKGTGLGLSVCYRIAERHQARIDFDTSSSGTEVLVRFKHPE